MTHHLSSLNHLPNDKNIYLTPAILKEIYQRVGITDYRLTDISNYQQAFIHKSYVTRASEELEIELQANEVLEFEGDGILGGYVARYLIERYPNEQEGFLTVIRSRLVETRSLARFAKYLGFDKYLIISKLVEEQKGRESPKLLENLFESFIGAIYRDNGGFQHDPWSLWLPHLFIRKTMETTVNFGELIQKDENYKAKLMQLFHQHFKGQHPVYRLIKREGPTNNAIFTCGVVHPTNPEIIIAQAEGRSKVQAEQQAAKLALGEGERPGGAILPLLPPPFRSPPISL